MELSDDDGGGAELDGRMYGTIQLLDGLAVLELALEAGVVLRIKAVGVEDVIALQCSVTVTVTAGR